MQNKMKTISFLKRSLSASLLTLMLLSTQGVASATILFQDDTFADIDSDAIQIGANDAGAVNTSVRFGADTTASENGNITWNITTNSFAVDHTVDITGGLTTTGDTDFSAATQTRLRESSSPNTLAACTDLNEVIVNTTANRLEVCTTTGIAGVAVWTAPAPAVPTGAVNPATCSVGQLFFNTTSSSLQVCTATNTWNTAGPQNFEDVYAWDSDDTLTTSNGNFTLARGSGSFSVTGTGTTTLNQSSLTSTSTGGMTLSAGAASTISTSAGNLGVTSSAGDLNLSGGSASSTAINLTTSNAAGGITGSWGTGGLNFSSATGAFTISGAGASSVNATAGNLSLTTTTSGNVNLTSADNVNLTSGAGDDVSITSGDDVLLDDAQLSAPVQLTNTATGFAATLGGGGIIDNINSFTLTTNGNGASNVGVEDTGSNLQNIDSAGTVTDVQDALETIDARLGTALKKNEVLSFYPEYPDTVVFPDGTANVGTLRALYDDTNDEHYYNWTTNNAALQDIDLRFRFPLPDDFVDVNDFTFKYRTAANNNTSNAVDFQVYNATDETAGAPTLCGGSTGNFSNNVWTTGTITEATLETGCTGATALNAGDIIEVLVKLFDNSGAADAADAGLVTLGYDNQ